MLRTLWLSVFCLLVGAQSFAQPSSGQAGRFGFLGGYSTNAYSSDFSELPGSPYCCHQTYRGEWGGGVYGGVFASFALTGAFSLDFALSYADQSSSLFYEKPGIFPVNDGMFIKNVDGVLRRSINATITTFGIEPRIQYGLFDAFQVSAGVRIGWVIERKYNETESIILPKEYDSYTGPERNTTSNTRDIPDMRKMLASLSFGIGYDASPGFIHPFILTPEVSYTLGLMNVVKSIDWRINSLRAGLRVSVGG